MDGWYVRQLLLTRDSIRKNIFKESHNYKDVEHRMDRALVVDFEDDTYNDLLIVEDAFENLYSKNMLTSKEHVVSTMLINGYNIIEIADELKMHKVSVMPIFYNVCSKIAFYLGGYFTNEGFLQRILDKHELNKEQIDKLCKIMEK